MPIGGFPCVCEFINQFPCGLAPMFQIAKPGVAICLKPHDKYYLKCLYIIMLNVGDLSIGIKKKRVMIVMIT